MSHGKGAATPGVQNPQTVVCEWLWMIGIQIVDLGIAGLIPVIHP